MFLNQKFLGSVKNILTKCHFCNGINFSIQNTFCFSLQMLNIKGPMRFDNQHVSQFYYLYYPSHGVK